MYYTGNIKNDVTKRDTPSTNNSLCGISQYIQVLKGCDGRDGALGLKGDKGEQGMKGEQGPIGLQGPKSGGVSYIRWVKQLVLQVLPKFIVERLQVVITTKEKSN